MHSHIDRIKIFVLIHNVNYTGVMHEFRNCSDTFTVLSVKTTLKYYL